MPSAPHPDVAPRAALLELRAARLWVRLGWIEEERAAPQAVDLQIRIRFATAPAACESDALTDTVCYATLIARARELCAEREFRLLEHLAWILGCDLRALVPLGADMDLRVTKLHPPVDELFGGVSFELTLPGTHTTHR